MSKVEEFQHRVAAAMGEPQDRKMPQRAVAPVVACWRAAKASAEIAQPPRVNRL